MALYLDNSVIHGHRSARRTQWHYLHFREVAFFLDTNIETGLTPTEAENRRGEYGWNQLTTQQEKKIGLRFLLQFKQIHLCILLLAGGITGILGFWTDAIVIWGVVVCHAMIGCLVESKIEDTVVAVATRAKVEATTVRGGQKARILARELVQGDLVLLNCGDKIPADLRLVSTQNLQVDEFALSGEALPMRKISSSVSVETPLTQRSNMVYAGTFVVFGQGMGIVVATGNTTAWGQQSQPIKNPSCFSTSLTQKFDKFIYTLLYAILTVASLTFVVASRHGYSLTKMSEVAVALVVSGIPQGLPTIIYMTIAIALAKIVRRNTIVRELSVVEKLSRATAICSQKTGILTENQMTVQFICAGQQKYTISGVGYNLEGTIRKIDSPQPIHFGGRFLNPLPNDSCGNSKQENFTSNTALRECLVAGLLCNDAHLKPEQNQWHVVGDLTEGALVVVARKAGLSQSKLTEAMPRLDTIPFESEFQYMATLHGSSKKDKRKNALSFVLESPAQTIYVKGSVEAILKRCQQMLDHRGKLCPLNRVSVEQEAENMAKQGLRVLAFGKKLVYGYDFLERENIESGLVFLGLQGIMNPPREEVIPAIQACLSAGIQVKMITGDHLMTAVAIAQKLGLHKDGETLAFEGQQLAQMSDGELAQAVETGVVFARIAPPQKQRLIEALQAKGEIAIVTGDSVNDAPALRQADIGIAMGSRGTDVAKEAADLLLLDDNFASIEAVIEESRTMIRNLRKVMIFMLPVNGGEAIAILLSVLMAWELPILPLQILWLNMVHFVAMTIPLAFEPKSQASVQLPPHRHHLPLLSKQSLWRIVVMSTLNGILIIGVFAWAYRITGDIEIARTMAIQALIAGRIVDLISLSKNNIAITAKCQGKDTEIYKAPAIAIGILCTIVLQITFSQWSLMNGVFHSVPLSFSQWLISLVPVLPIIGLTLFK